MNFKDVKVGQTVRSIINQKGSWIVLEKKRGGWVLLRPTGEGFEDLRFNARAKILRDAT